MKKILSLILICLLLPSMPARADGIAVYVDGAPVAFTADSGAPFIENGRTLVPLRVTMEAFGASVDWEANTKTAIVRKDTTTVRCRIGENCIYRNNVRIENDAAAKIVAGRTYLPIRAVLEAFGATVSWDGAVRVAGGSAAFIAEIENTPSVTTNFWGNWNDALATKGNEDYAGAIEKIRAIANAFLAENASASDAMLFKHLGECYANLKAYDNASACFTREAYYWSLTPGMEESRIDAARRARLIKTGSQIYVKNTHPEMGGRMDFGAAHEPRGGVLLGAYAEGDTKIYDPYNPSRFYMDTFPQLIGKDMSGYLLYLPYGTKLALYQTHIDKAAQKGKFIQIALEPHAGVAMTERQDGYLEYLAKEMENAPCPMFLRFAGEMNDTTSTWYSPDPAPYIKAFRTVADVFHKHAPSVPVIWAPNFYPGDTIPLYYPGDEYVDYVGISSYMMHQPITDPLGKGVDRSRWSSQLDTLYSLYGHKKPIIIVEGGASYMDYDTYADITPFAARQIEDFYTYLPIKYPNVKFCFVFDSDRDRQKFSLSNNPTYLQGYQNGTKNPLYGDSLTENQYQYDYYELGNNVSVLPEKTELCAFVQTPSGDTAYVIYSIGGTDIGTAYAAPYSVPVDFAPHSGQTVSVTVRAFDSAHALVSSYTVNIRVL